MTANPTVALLGTGTMGAGMAANIARSRPAAARLEPHA